MSIAWLLVVRSGFGSFYSTHFIPQINIAFDVSMPCLCIRCSGLTRRRPVQSLLGRCFIHNFRLILEPLPTHAVRMRSFNIQHWPRSQLYVFLLPLQHAHVRLPVGMESWKKYLPHRVTHHQPHLFGFFICHVYTPIYSSICWCIRNSSIKLDFRVSSFSHSLLCELFLTCLLCELFLILLTKWALSHIAYMWAFSTMWAFSHIA